MTDNRLHATDVKRIGLTHVLTKALINGTSFLGISSLGSGSVGLEKLRAVVGVVLGVKACTRSVSVSHTVRAWMFAHRLWRKFDE